MSDRAPPTTTMQTGEQAVEGFTRSLDFKEIYASTIRGGMSPWDMALHFGVIMDYPPAIPTTEERATVRFSPQTFKLLVIAVNNMMQQWESRFGKITIPGTDVVHVSGDHITAPTDDKVR